MTNQTKPPIGVVPRNIHNIDRARDILDAMSAYVLVEKTIPQIWFEELNELYGNENNIEIDKDTKTLNEIRVSIIVYYKALTNREHTGIAQDKAFNKIQQILDMHWK